MVAVVEHRRLHRPTEVLLQVESVAEARDVVVTRMQQQHRLTNAPEGPTDRIDQPPQLQHGAAGRAELPRLGAVAALESRCHEPAHTRVFDAVWIPLGKIE